MYAVGVLFLDEDDNLRDGELINPYHTENGEVVVHHEGDLMLSVMCPTADGGEDIHVTHASRVSTFFNTPGLPLTVDRPVTIFDQDAQ